MDSKETYLLLERLKNGDQTAFETIFNCYWEPLLLYLSRLVKDQDDAEDLLQNIFLNLWGKSQTGQVQHLHTWLYGAARKSALFYHRSKENQQKLMASILDHISKQSVALNELTQTKELLGIIDAEIRALPARMREVFLLSRTENLSYKQITEQLHISEQTVKKQISNALGILRKNLKKRGLYTTLLFLLIDLY